MCVEFFFSKTRMKRKDVQKISLIKEKSFHIFLANVFKFVFTLQSGIRQELKNSQALKVFLKAIMCTMLKIKLLRERNVFTCFLFVSIISREICLMNKLKDRMKQKRAFV